MDRVWYALRAIDGIGHFDCMLERCKANGLSGRPKRRPWPDLPEAEKLRMIVGLADREGPTGVYALAVIGREIELKRLPAWRLDALEALRLRLDRDELESGHPRDWSDHVLYALRVAEFEARVEDLKHHGDRDSAGRHRRWEEFSDEEKLHRIVAQSGILHLYFEPKEAEIIAREIDVARLPEGRRRGTKALRPSLSGAVL